MDQLYSLTEQGNLDIKHKLTKQEQKQAEESDLYNKKEDSKDTKK